MPIQNTKLVMYIAHIWGTRLPAIPMPHQIWPVQATIPAVRIRATTLIQPKYRLPGGASVRATSRVTSANVGEVAWLSLIGSRVLPDDLLQVGDGGPRPDLFQDVIGARRVGEPHDGALRILEIAEGDRSRGARLLAGGQDVAVPHGALRVTRVVLARDDALNAHRALLHDPELANRHVGVQLHVERRGELVLEPVEAAHVIGTVVAAVSSPDTTVVHLTVETFFRTIRRKHGTDGLARGDLTMLAEHRQEVVRGPIRLPFRPALDADPLELSPVGRLGAPDDGHVVLRLAGDHARLAADARVHVDRHAPAVPRVLLVRVHAEVLLLLRLAPERLLARGAQIHVLRELATLLVVSRLEDGERAPGARLGEPHPDPEVRGATRRALGGRPEQRHRIARARGRRHVARRVIGRVAMADRDGDRLWMERRRDGRGELDRAVGGRKPDDVAPGDAELRRRLP